ncbi:MAB_1171c family putative transporter [Streptomyces sp. NPDC003860]
MKDLLHSVNLTMASTALLCLLWALRKDRRNPALLSLGAALFFSVLNSAAVTTPMWVRIDQVLGVSNSAAVITQCCVIALLVCQMNLITYWRYPADEARRRAQIHYALGVLVIVGLVTFFALLSPAQQQPTSFPQSYVHDPYYQLYMGLYIAAYTVAEIFVVRMYWGFASRVEEPWIARGLRIFAVGGALTLGWCVIRGSAIIGEITGAFHLDHLDPIAWISGEAGVSLSLTALFLPALAIRARGARAWARDHLAFYRLRPLWTSLYQATPTISLTPPPDQVPELLRFRSMGFDHCRRRVEIRDGQIELRLYLDPQTRQESEQRRQAEGLRDLDLAAAVTADQIHYALIRHAAGQRVDEPTDYADAHLPISQEEEAAHLLRVARHFRPPSLSVTHSERALTSF